MEWVSVLTEVLVRVVDHCWIAIRNLAKQGVPNSNVSVTIKSALTSELYLSHICCQMIARLIILHDIAHTIIGKITVAGFTEITLCHQQA
jgi:hypothetical protein